MKNKKLTTYQMAVTALMAAALCVLGPLSVQEKALTGKSKVSMSSFRECGQLGAAQRTKPERTPVSFPLNLFVQQ